MKRNLFLFPTIIGLFIYGIIATVKVDRLQKSLKSTKLELLGIQNDLHDANSRLENISEKFSMQSSSSDDIENKLDNIKSYTSELKSSINALLRELRWADCETCADVIWDIERKAKAVESDFQSLQSEIY